MVDKEMEIAKSNRNMPAFYRSYNLEDHLFSYDLKIAQADKKLKLDLHLELFSNNFRYFIEKKPLQEISFRRLEKLREKTDRFYHMMKNVQSDSQTCEVTVTTGDQEKHLYMCRHYISSLNENIGLLQQTQVLQACCNYITRIPFSIKHLRHLKMLILSRNRIRELPEELGCCKSLRELDLSNNLLESLPNSIASLKALSIMNLSNNRLRILNRAVGKLQSLKNIHLDSNRLTHLPLELLKLPFLSNLLTDNNPIAEYTESSIRQIGTHSMLEECARHVVRNNKRIPRNFSKNLVNFMLGVKECSFCGGPYFEHYFEIEAMQEFDNKYYTVQYTLCSRHYENHSERLPTLFASTHGSTIPNKLLENNMPAVTEIFEPFCHSEELLQRIKDRFDDADDRMPLICLSLYNSHFFKQFVLEKKRCTALHKTKSRHQRGEKPDHQ